MAHAHSDVFATPVKVRYDRVTDEIYIRCGGVRIVICPDDAAPIRDDLSRAITEAAQKHAQAVAKDAQEVTP